MNIATHPFDALMNITARPPVVFVRGEGAFLWDDHGKRYLDFMQGWAVNCLGHSPPVVADALAAQAGLLLTPSPAFYNAPSLELAKLLTDHSAFDQVFFANSGAEANEGAIKLARKYGALHKGGAHEIITFENGFHGRTLVTMSASGKKAFEPLFEPKVSGFPKAKLNDLGLRRAPGHGQDDCRDAGADPGRSRRLAGDGAVPARPAGIDQGAGSPADRRRDPDRHGADRKAVRLRACGHRARHHDAWKGHRRRRSASRAAGDKRSLLLRARRPGRNVQRQPVDVRGGACRSASRRGAGFPEIGRRQRPLPGRRVAADFGAPWSWRGSRPGGCCSRST